MLLEIISRTLKTVKYIERHLLLSVLFEPVSDYVALASLKLTV